MNVVHRRILLFGIQFLPLLALFVWAYPRALPPYERLVVSGINPCLGRTYPRLQAESNAEGELDAYLLNPGAPPQKLYDRRYRPDAIFLSLILLPALLLATPLPLRRRALATVVGLAILFMIHALALTALLRTYVCLKADPGSFVCAWIKGFALTSGQVGAVVIWALLTWSYWLPGLRGRFSAGAADVPGRNTPCPCGSGRKYKHCCAR